MKSKLKKLNPRSKTKTIDEIKNKEFGKLGKIQEKYESLLCEMCQPFNNNNDPDNAPFKDLYVAIKYYQEIKASLKDKSDNFFPSNPSLNKKGSKNSKRRHHSSSYFYGLKEDSGNKMNYLTSISNCYQTILKALNTLLCPAFDEVTEQQKIILQNYHNIIVAKSEHWCMTEHFFGHRIQQSTTSIDVDFIYMPAYAEWIKNKTFNQREKALDKSLFYAQNLEDEFNSGTYGLNAMHSKEYKKYINSIIDYTPNRKTWDQTTQSIKTSI